MRSQELREGHEMLFVREISKICLKLLGYGVLFGFLFGVYKALSEVISHQYFRYGMYNLVLFDFQRSLNTWVLIVPLAMVVSYFIGYSIYRTCKWINGWMNGNLIDFKLKSPKRCADLSIGISLVLIFYVWVGYLVNHHLLPELFSPKSIIGNIGIIILTVALIFPLRMVLSRIEYGKFLKTFGNRLMMKNVKVKYIKISSAIIAVLMLSLNVRIFLSKEMNPPQGPNVILIGVDTLRVDHLGSYGYGRDTSPNIDGLARDGILFENAFSQASWTLPAFATILTSLYPSVHGATDERKKLANEFMTLAEIFKEDFYETGAIVSGIFVSKQYGFQQGFNVFEEERPFNDIHISSRSITERASKFMEKNKERRFFLFLHYFDPHARYFLHKEYVLELYREAERRRARYC
jgi:glucan phosphoethanolaminetransferase (alkaline phosphatase superfamily)